MPLNEWRGRFRTSSTTPDHCSSKSPYSDLLRSSGETTKLTTTFVPRQNSSRCRTMSLTFRRTTSKASGSGGDPDPPVRFRRRRVETDFHEIEARFHERAGPIPRQQVTVRD